MYLVYLLLKFCDTYLEVPLISIEVHTLQGPVGQEIEWKIDFLLLVEYCIMVYIMEISYQSLLLTRHSKFMSNYVIGFSLESSPIIFAFMINFHDYTYFIKCLLWTSSSYIILVQVLGDTCSYLLGDPLGKYHKIEKKIFYNKIYLQKEKYKIIIQYE